MRVSQVGANGNSQQLQALMKAKPQDSGRTGTAVASNGKGKEVAAVSQAAGQQKTAAGPKVGSVQGLDQKVGGRINKYA